MLSPSQFYDYISTICYHTLQWVSDSDSDRDTDSEIGNCKMYFFQKLKNAFRKSSWGNLQDKNNNSNKNEDDSSLVDGKVWWYECASILAVCSSCVSCGTLLGYTSSAIPSMRLEYANDNSTGMGEILHHHAALIGGLGPLGAILGALVAALPLRYMGPRRTIAILGIPMLLVSWISIALASSIMTIFIGRFLGGIGVGGVISSAPLYVCDIASTKNRGRMGVMPQLLMISGILISYIMGALLNWKDLALASVGFPVMTGFLLTLAPDSPKYLIGKGKMEEASEVLRKINGKSVAEQIIKESESQKDNDTEVPSEPSKLTFHWKDPATIKSIFACLGLISIQQLSGVNGITFFAGTIFQSNMSSIILGVTQLLASFLSTFMIERFGRKFLLKCSTTLVFLSSVVLGTYYYILEDMKISLPSWVPLVSLITFTFGFALGLGPVTWILVAELLPQTVRSTLNPLIIAYNWFCVFLITTSFPWLKAEIHFYGVFWLYAGISFIGLLFVWSSIPETKGKSFEQVQNWFNKKENKGNDL